YRPARVQETQKRERAEQTRTHVLPPARFSQTRQSLTAHKSPSDDHAPHRTLTGLAGFAAWSTQTRHRAPSDASVETRPIHRRRAVRARTAARHLEATHRPVAA